jgi:outer membrane lipoprotein carrier protein
MLQCIHSYVFLFLAVISAPDVKVLVSRLEARYRSARTLQATFLERYTENGRLTRAEAGTVYFRRPGKMRWEYDSPEKNLFLVDGKTAWFYVRADRTVTRVPAKESSDWRTPLALLAGEMKLSRVCEKIQSSFDEPAESSADAMLYCELRGAEAGAKEQGGAVGVPDTTVARDTVYLEIVQSSGDLVRILVKSAGGVGIEFRFAGWQYNPQVADSLFHFTVPPGVAIVNGELPSNQTGARP